MLRIDIMSLLLGNQPSAEEDEKIKNAFGDDGKYYEYLKKYSDDLIRLGNGIEKGAFAKHLDRNNRAYLAACCYAMAISAKSYEAYEYLNRLLDREQAEQTKNPLLLAIPHQEPTLQNLMDIMTKKDSVLAKRLDIAYLIYQKSKQVLGQLNADDLKIRQNAIDFIKKVLQVKSEDDLNKLMADRNAKKHLDPEYIPGKKPELKTRLPDPLAVKKSEDQNLTEQRKQRRETAKYELRKLALTALEQQRRGVLAVNPNDQKEDVKKRTVMLTPEERDARRVIVAPEIVNNKNEYFLQGLNPDGKFSNCDTSSMISHNKNGFAAYTINLNGEFSIFTHNNMADNYAHSSMNAGRPVLCAGEVKIVNGKLLEITDYSGHYLPDPRNVYEALKHFKKQGLDISEVRIALFHPVPIPEIAKTDDLAKFNHAYKGEDFFNFMQAHEKNYVWHLQNAVAKIVVNKLVANERNELLTAINHIYWQNPHQQGNNFATTLAYLHNNLQFNPHAARATRETRDILRKELQGYQNHLLTVMEEAKSRLNNIPGVNPDVLSIFDRHLNAFKSISFKESYLQNYNQMISIFNMSQKMYAETLQYSISMTKTNITNVIDTLSAELEAYKNKRNSFFKTPNRSDRIKLANETIQELQKLNNSLVINPASDPQQIFSSLQKNKSDLDGLIANFITNARKIGIDTSAGKGKGLLFDVIARLQPESIASENKQSVEIRKPKGRQEDQVPLLDDQGSAKVRRR